MKTEKSSNWFLRGLVFTFIVVLLAALAVPTFMGRAQEGTNDNLPEDTVSEAPTGRTDDPLGRVQIPLAEGADLPLDNSLEYNQSTGGEFDLDANEANINREIELRDATSGNYTSPLVISAADFSADGANPDSMFFPFGGGYFQGDAENYGCVVAPVYLPDGVTVTDLFATVYDNDAAFNIAVNMRRVDNFAGGTDTMTNDANSSGDFAGVQVISDFSIVEPLVSYPDYSYFVTTCLLSGSTRIYSVRVYYDE